MKKVKFTLGLTLVMLLLGATVANAGKLPYRNEPAALHRTSIGYSVSIVANPHYVNIENWFRDYTWENPDFSLNNDFYTHEVLRWDTTRIASFSPPLDARVKSGLVPVNSTNYTAASRYSYEGLAPTNPSSSNYYTGIFGIEKKGADLHNDFIVELSYKDGNEIIPVVKRTLVVGEWYFDDANNNNVTNSGEYNKIQATDVVRTDYLRIDSATFRPHHDRKSGVARFVFSEDILELARQVPIFSVSYEISIHDEIGTIGSEAYEPPVMSEPENMRGVKFDIGAGITTDIPINTIGNTLFVPSFKHLTFKVYSSKEIEVTTNRSSNPADGVVVEKIPGENAYNVTIKRIQSNFTVSVIQKEGTKSGTGEDDSTGNGAPTGDAIWAAGGTLYVNAAAPGQIKIYSITGQLYRTEYVSGSFTLPIPKGVYIIQLNGKAYKVIP